MSRWLLPTGMVALLLSALTLAAQVREDPRQTPVPPQAGQKAVSPDKDLNARDKAPADKQARRKHCHVYLGVCTVPVEEMSNRTRRKLKLPDEDGVFVIEVMPDSPANEAGLKHGDVITHVNGKLIDDEEELSKDLHQLGPGKPVKLNVIREGKKQEIKAELEEVPAGEHGAPSDQDDINDELMGMCHQHAARIERLERKIARLEKRLAELDRARSAKNNKE